MSDDIHHFRVSQTGESGCEMDAEQWVAYTREREIADYARGDMVVAVTSEDAARVAGLRPAGRDPALARESVCVRHIPMAISEFNSFQNEGDAFLFVGSNHHANQQAVRWLLEQVLPRLRGVLRNVKLYLVGSDVWVDLARGHPGARPHAPPRTKVI